MAQLESPITINSALIASLQGHDVMSEEDEHYFAQNIGAPGLHEPIEFTATDPVPSCPAYTAHERIPGRR